MTLPLGTKIGNIRLIKLLGRGGMGEVYVGYDEKLERQVAIKSLRRDLLLGEGLKKRLLHEARILSQIDHPNICRIHDFLEVEGHDFLVMELIEGKSLRKAMRGGFEERQAMEIAIQVTQVLVATHAEGIIHRDLKPENVMLVAPESARGRGSHGASDYSAPGRVKVLDFGVARSVGLERPPSDMDLEGTDHGGASPSTSAGETDPDWIAATPMFMSPEQARQEPLTTASDMYSLGLVLQELFTGKPPYDPKLPPMRLYLRAARADTRPVTGVDAELTELIERLKSKDPAHRPTAVDTLKELEWIQGRRRRRQRKLATLAALVFLALLAAVMTYQAIRIARVARHAEEQRLLAVEERARAEAQTALVRSRHLTAEASKRYENQVDLALLLSLEAQRFGNSLDSRSSMMAALQANPRLRKILRGHDAAVLDLAWSQDGKTLASSSYGIILLWNPESGEIVGRLTGHPRRVWRLAFSPDGSTLASCGEDGTLRLWDLATGQLRLPPIESHAGEILYLAWKGDGKTLATTGRDGTIRFWDAATGKPQGQPITGVDGWRVVWSADDATLAANVDDYSIQLWDMPARQARGSPVLLPGAFVWTLEPQPGGGILAWSSGNTVALVGFENAELLGTLPDASDGSVRDLAWSPDGRLLAGGTADHQAVLWDVEHRQLLGNPFSGHSGEVLAVAFSPEGRTLATAGGDGLIVLWDASGDYHLGQTFTAHESWVVGLAWSGDGKTLASSSSDETVRLWDPETGRLRRRPIRTNAGTWTLAWSADGGTLYTGGHDGKIHFLDPKNGKDLRPPIPAHSHDVSAVVLTRDGRRLVSGGRDGFIRFWDALSGEPLGEPWQLAGGDLRIVVLSPDESLLATSTGKDIQLWDMSSPEPSSRVLSGHTDRVRDVVFSPDGRQLVSASRDGTIRRWDTSTASPVGEPLVVHEGAVRALAWSDDGKLLASGGIDETIVLWDTATWEPIVRVGGHRGWVLALDWHGRLLASSSIDGTVMVRDFGGDLETWRRAACRRARRNLTQEEWDRYVDAEVPYHETCPEFPSGRVPPPREDG